MTIDMAHFETQFQSNQLHPDMDDVLFEKVCNLRDRIADLTETVEYLKSFLNHDDDELADLQRMRDSLNQVLDEIRRRTARINDGQRIIKNEIRPISNQLEASQREWVRLMAEIEAQKRERNNRLQLEMLTARAPWRSRALKHQWEGAVRLTSAKRAILGDSPGLGKTLQSIMTVDMLKAKDEARKILIFCPKPVLDGFQRDFAKFSPEQFVFVLDQAGKGAKSNVLDLVKVAPEVTVLTNYEVWRKDKTIIDQLIHCQFDTIILDEAHNLKDSRSSTAKGIKRIVQAENKCMHCDALTFGSTCPKCGDQPTKLFGNRSVKNVFPMTGTPILNRPQDLFTMLNLLDSEAFPTENKFLQDFCIRKCAGCHRSYNCLCETSRWRWTFDSGGEARLLSRLGMRFTARNRDSAGVVMPPQEVKHHYFELDPELYPKQTKLIEELRDKARIQLSESKSVTELLVVAWYTRMRQSAIWPDAIKIKEFNDEGEYVRTWQPEIGESILMDEGEKLIRDAVESGNRVIVFSKFKEALKEMERRLLNVNSDDDPFCTVVRYDSDLSDADRLIAQHDFDLTVTDPKKSKFQVMLAQYDSAKVGLNLHGAQEVVFLDREWNPGMETQAMDRVRRIGSEFDTIVHILHCKGTATDLIDELIKEKEAMLNGFESEIEEINMQEKLRKYLGE